MKDTSSLKNIARLFIDAFDVDIQNYISKLLNILRETPSGIKIVEWASSNPLVFESLIRAISASVQRLPKNDNIWIETISDHLERLPFEIRRTIKDSTVKTNIYCEKDFCDKYEKALRGLNKEDLEQVANLDKYRLVEWVNSPPQIRPFLLKKWNEQNKSKYDKSIPIAMKDLAEKMKNRIRQLESQSNINKEEDSIIGLYRDKLEKSGLKDKIKRITEIKKADFIITIDPDISVAHGEFRFNIKPTIRGVLLEFIHISHKSGIFQRNKAEIYYEKVLANLSSISESTIEGWLKELIKHGKYNRNRILRYFW